LLLCREPLSIRCFSETDAGRCSGEKENGEAGYIFTDYITRLNLLLAMQKTDCVTVQNEYMKEVISINIPHFEKGIHVIPGVPGTAVFGSMDRAAARSPKVHTRKHVLYRGPIERLTGLHRVIEALSSVHADCPVSLTISGISVDGHYLPECQETASRSMKKNKFLSITFNDREDGVDYSGYDVVLLTSNRGEVSSMETARAAMQGAAVIALHPPETGMSIAGISCKSDVNSIAETVWTLLVDEDLRISMVKETSGLLMEYFSPDRQGRMIQDLVREHSPVFRQQEHSLLDG
jgi:glycosyltransferase involved in cell wall biosynthesis